ncbi:hypothetical protein Tco_1120247 [Tanacetum coccineum]
MSLCRLRIKTSYHPHPEIASSCRGTNTRYQAHYALNVLMQTKEEDPVPLQIVYPHLKIASSSRGTNTRDQAHYALDAPMDLIPLQIIYLHPEMLQVLGVPIKEVKHIMLFRCKARGSSKLRWDSWIQHPYLISL